MFGGKCESLALIIFTIYVILLLIFDKNPLPKSKFELKSRVLTSSSSSPPPLVCNFAKGKWIKDRKRPFYSGFECKKWISTMWACREMDRSDFSFENYRWQPQGCDMPEFDSFTFLRRMENKTIAFIGDSLGREQFQSLMCMTTGGKDTLKVQNVGYEYGLVIPKGAYRPSGWAYRFPTTNTTILFYWSSTLTDLVPMNNKDSSNVTAMHLDRPPSFIRNNLNRFDVMVLNTGHHWTEGEIKANNWVMHVNGTIVDGKYFKDVRKAKEFTIRSIVKWLDRKILIRHKRLKVFFTTISPRHNIGRNCNNTVPLSRGSEVKGINGSIDTIVENALKGTRIKILDITALSELRDEAHISRYKLKPKKTRNVTLAPLFYDCLHWCLPGIPDTWNELLIAQI